MSISMKQAAEELLKIAADIQQEASEVTQFVCDKCNHTASLATINTKRKTAAEEQKANASDITVNDKVQCPACDDGIMSYNATEESESFYFDPDKAAADEEEVNEEKGETPEEQAKEEETGKEDKKASIDYDSLRRYQ